MITAIAAATLIISAADATDVVSIEPYEPQAFRAQVVVLIEAPIEEVFDAATGDVTGWWDHSFSLNPAEMVIEPVFGGRFYERLYADRNDGALHATVIYVDAPTKLTMNGPLGLSGRAVDLVSAWTLSEPELGGTEFTVDLSMAGEVDSDLASAVAGVWDHFIRERLKVYIEAGCHIDDAVECAAFASE
ncbi:SRPBCC domain-containing protein [Maricaulaceae bacterium NA33B04]|nr:SRPBCC domain-containing protein [Maricaulaceae bacterium NA33B04]